MKKEDLNAAAIVGLLAGVIIATVSLTGQANAWIVDGMYNVCSQTPDSSWEPVQVTKERWEELEKQKTAFRYEGPSVNHRPPFNAQWCEDNVPDGIKPVEPEQPAPTPPAPAPAVIAPQPVATPAPVPQAAVEEPAPTYADFQGK